MQNSPLPSAGIRHPIGMIQIKWQFAEEIFFFFLKRMRDGKREEKTKRRSGVKKHDQAPREGSASHQEANALHRLLLVRLQRSPPAAFPGHPSLHAQLGGYTLRFPPKTVSKAQGLRIDPGRVALR